MHYNIIVKEYLQQYNGSCVSDTFWVRTLAEKRSGATDLPNRCTGPCNAEPFPYALMRIASYRSLLITCCMASSGVIPMQESIC